MPTEAPILAVRGLTKRFGGVTALEGVGFELHRGEVLALAGDNGAGKSTLIKAISGVHQPDEGEIVYKGERVTLSNPRHAREIGIETIYQDLALADNLDVGANIFLGREPAAPLFGCPAAPRPRADARRRARGPGHARRSTSPRRSWACRCAACPAASARPSPSAAPSSGRPSS